jgi:hypothetical protein
LTSTAVLSPYDEIAKNIEYDKLLKKNLETIVSDMGLPLPKVNTKANLIALIIGEEKKGCRPFWEQLKQK